MSKPGVSPRHFSNESQERIVLRLEGGETIAAVAGETGVRRKLLYQWRDAYRAMGTAGFNRKRGPKPGPRKLKPLQPEANKRSALAQASTRIAELERLVGRQQMDIDFFRKALRALERPAAQGKPASASSKLLKP